jgi:sporulation protein YlmC with PRC-barrel domain
MLKTLLTTSAIALALAMPTALSAQEAPTDDATSETLEAAPEAGSSDVDVSPIDESGSDTGAAPAETTEPATDETMGQEGTTEPADETMGQEGTTQPADETMGQEGTTEPAAEEATGQEDAAEGEAAPVVSTDAVIPEEEEGALRADKVIGMKVVDSNGEQIGKITDIILNGEGQMTGLVISSGGFLGIGAKKVGIKVEEANIDVESETVVANLSEEALKQAPKFKTQEDIQAELEAQQRQQEMETAPAAGTPGTY